MLTLLNKVYLYLYLTHKKWTYCKQFTTKRDRIYNTTHVDVPLMDFIYNNVRNTMKTILQLSQQYTCGTESSKSCWFVTINYSCVNLNDDT